MSSECTEGKVQDKPSADDWCCHIVCIRYDNWQLAVVLFFLSLVSGRKPTNSF